MSYLPSPFYSQPQEAYRPSVGPPPATADQIDQYDKVKRKGNILILIVVAMVVLLIALLIAVFVIAIRPKSGVTATSDPQPRAMQVEFDAIKTDTPFQSSYLDSTSNDYQVLASSTCSQLEGVIKARGYVVGGCVINSMSQSSTSATQMAVHVTVLSDGTQTDSELLLGIGSALDNDVQPPLEVVTSSIRKVAAS